MKRSFWLVAALLVVSGGVGVADAATITHTQHTTSKARISEGEARASAIARVPRGVIKSHELEKEHGKLIYSYDIVVAGKTGIEEVNVDAMTGRVLSVKHETPKAERSERIKEQKEKTSAVKGSGH